MIIFFSFKGGEAPESQQKQDQELTVAQIMNSFIVKFRLKLKKVEKTTKKFRYDLNQISYDYTKEVTNRFKGLDVIDRVPDELWTDIEQGSRPSPRKRNAKKQNGCLRRPSK